MPPPSPIATPAPAHTVAPAAAAVGGSGDAQLAASRMVRCEFAEVVSPLSPLKGLFRQLAGNTHFPLYVH